MDVDNILKNINSGNNSFDSGTIINIKDFVVEIVGIENCYFYEKINLSNKGFGYVTMIGTDSISVAVLYLKETLSLGDEAVRTNELFRGIFSEDSLGGMINIFGENPLNDKKYEKTKFIDIESDNIPIMDRIDVCQPLQTGISAIDLMYPIGKGQRQLIIGDKKTGKTQIALDAIVNQKGKDTICIYCPIGKKMKEVKNIYYDLIKKDAMKYTIIIPAFNDYLAPCLVLTPYFAISIAQIYMKSGYNVLVVYDDLKRQADAYREISLIEGKNPGRDSYPSDVFFLHSRLLEKGCRYKNGASITILPIIETKGGDITDYISTNVISITDGQIVLSANNFQKGIKPAIDFGLSVSRLGGSVQTKEMKKVGIVVRRKLLSYLEMASIFELSNPDDLSESIRNSMEEGKKILENLKQNKFSPLSDNEMIEKFGFVVSEDGQH